MPFGLRKVRDTASNKVIALEVDPEKRKPPCSGSVVPRWQQPGGHPADGQAPWRQRQHADLQQLAQAPALTGRLAWKVDNDGNHEQVQEEPSFTGLIDDAAGS